VQLSDDSDEMDIGLIQAFHSNMQRKGEVQNNSDQTESRGKGRRVNQPRSVVPLVSEAHNKPFENQLKSGQSGQDLSGLIQAFSPKFGGEAS